MRFINTDSRLPDPQEWCLVHSPAWSESGFEVAQLEDGHWYNAAGQRITTPVESWFYCNHVKTP